MSWHVLHLKPRNEKKLARYCEILGLTCYLPMRQEKKVYQRRKVIVDKPVFPGYLFVSFTESDKAPVLKTNLVIRDILPPDERVFLDEIDRIRSALTVDPTLGSCKALVRGRHVRICAGPFRGIEGLVSFRCRTKVRLNVELIRQAVAVDVEEDWVEVLD